VFTTNSEVGLEAQSPSLAAITLAYCSLLPLLQNLGHFHRPEQNQGQQNASPPLKYENGTALGSDPSQSTPDGADEAIVTFDRLRRRQNQRLPRGTRRCTESLRAHYRQLDTTLENLSATNSRIRDADFAQESAELARTQVLQQAGLSSPGPGQRPTPAGSAATTGLTSTSKLQPALPLMPHPQNGYVLGIDYLVDHDVHAQRMYPYRR